MRFFLVLFLFSQTLIAEVVPFEKYFKLEDWKKFFPGNDFKQLQEKGELVSQKEDVMIIKYKAKHERYHFPIYIQVKGEKIIDTYFRLPTYFLHDVFHQSLINRWGKQEKYLKKENGALYLWKEKEGMRILYSGICTITCFPSFLSLTSAQAISEGKEEWKPLPELLESLEH